MLYKAYIVSAPWMGNRNLYDWYENNMRELREKHGRNLWNPKLIREHYRLKKLSRREWGQLKRGKKWNEIRERIMELYILGYKYWSITFIIAHEFGIYLSGAFINEFIKEKMSDYHVIKDSLFENANVIIRGRIELYNSIYAPALVLCAKELFDKARRRRMGVVVYFDSSLRNVYLKRNDDSRKKLATSNNRLMRVTFHCLPEKLRTQLKTSPCIYVDVHLNTSEFGLTRTDFINDVDARILFPYLERHGFKLLKKRLTNNDKLGDLICMKDGEVILIEITKAFSSGFNRVNQNPRYTLIGKLCTLALRSLTKAIMIAILHDKIRKNGLINEDFWLFAKFFGIKVIFTDFNQKWKEEVAERINEVISMSSSSGRT